MKDVGRAVAEFFQNFYRAMAKYTREARARAETPPWREQEVQAIAMAVAPVVVRQVAPATLAAPAFADQLAAGVYEFWWAGRQSVYDANKTGSTALKYNELVALIIRVYPEVLARHGLPVQSP